MGGSGAVGRAVVAELARAAIETTFTYFKNRTLAEALAGEHGQIAKPLDATDDDAVRELVASIAGLDVIIHCAGLLDGPIDRVCAVNARSAYVACRALRQATSGTCDFILVGGLDRAQSLPIPAPYAASQGMAAALCMALAKELGPGMRINMVALGLLDAGLSLGLDDAIRDDFANYSGLRRFGKAEEVAASIVWLALNNRYMNGRVIPINGGI